MLGIERKAGDLALQPPSPLRTPKKLKLEEIWQNLLTEGYGSKRAV
jgi:hypothetical protein